MFASFLMEQFLVKGGTTLPLDRACLLQTSFPLKSPETSSGERAKPTLSFLLHMNRPVAQELYFIASGVVRAGERIAK